MIKKGLILVFLFVLNYSTAQQKYPKDYFINPLEIPLVLSGSFGELRSNHFHAGLDIKTQQRTGLKVVAAAGGYVSRIRVSLWSYGKALYITHPNGYTTVYGHLKRFSPEIEAYIKKKQYAKKSYEIQVYPKPGELQVKKGELVAYTGNTGSSGGPHLHFEIRDIEARPLNPMLFGIDIADHKRPVFTNAVVYAKTDTSVVNKTNTKVDLVLKKQADGNYIANRVFAYGRIGIGVNSTDRMDGAINKNGLYDLSVEVNGKKIFEYTMNRISFNETRYINNFIDYARYIKLNQRVQKCFVDPNTHLSIYKKLLNNGFLVAKDSIEYHVVITARDFKGNKTTLTIPVQGKKDSIVKAKKVNKTPFFFKVNQVNTIKDSVVSASFPKNSFYEDFYFDYKYKNGIAYMHNRSVAVHKNFRLAFDVSKYPLEKVRKMYIVRKSKKGRLYYNTTHHKGNELYTYTKTLGAYTLATDLTKPKIFAHNFKNNQNLDKKKTLMVRISDTGSGIRSYSAHIDGKWILMEYEPKRGTLTYNFDDLKFQSGIHHLEVVVTDNVKNKTVYKAVFYRKY